MNIKLLLTSASLAASLVVAQPSLATTIASDQVAQFSDSSVSRLVKHHERLFSINEAMDGGVSVAYQNVYTGDWSTIDSDAATVDSFVADTASVDTFAVFQGKVYVATANNDGVSQLWKICAHCRPAGWEKSGAAGFGDTANTSVIDLFSTGEAIYALVNNSNGDTLYGSSDGDSWAQVGVAGLGLSASNVVGATNRVYDDLHYIYLATADGGIYRSLTSDLVTWDLVASLDGTTTALHGKFVGVTQNDMAMLYMTTDGLTYNQVGEDGLGNTNNTAVTRIYHIGRHIFTTVTNPTDGVELRRFDPDTSSWTLETSAGFDDANNVSISDLIKFRGHRYASVVNAVSGAAIYKLDRE